MNGMKNGVITLIDILGWKGIWTRRTGAIQDLQELINKIQDVNDALETEDDLNGTPNHFKSLKTEVKSISDTIAIITYCDNPNDALEYHGCINAEIISESINRKIPVRGATSYGQMASSNNIMVGPAVDEVASWYENTEWIGVIQTPSAMFLLDESKFKYEPIIWKRHSVRTKKNGIYDTYCVGWPMSWNLSRNRELLLERFIEMGPITPEIAQKYINTLEFYDKYTLEND